MVLKNALLIGVGLTLFGCSSGEGESTEMQAQTQGPMNTEEARNVFTLHCVSCHGVDGKLGKSNAADLSVSVMTEAQIQQTILNGNDKGMMPYAEILNQREVEGLVQFVQTLRK